MTPKTFDEIFSEVDKATKKADKIAILHKHSSPAMKAILGYTYDPNVKWLLPEGTPPFKMATQNMDYESRLSSEIKRLYLFVDGPTDTQRNLKQTRREQLFIEMLENIDPRDTKVLLGMKERKLPYKGLTRALVAEAFPKLAASW
jgi:hypothetical protein